MSSTVDQIKERLDIADVVAAYLKLESAGSNLRARCPFHNEKTPSFFVSPSRQTYHCFGCNRGGDIFSFVQEIEGLDFLGALKILADRAGVEIKREHQGKKTERENLFGIIEDATNFFEENLKAQDKVIEYLKGRGLSGETAKRFRVGYASEGWDNLYSTLKKKGHLDTLMEKAGLVVRGKRGFYDRFRGRIMFPIADSSGRVVGFSGRIFGSETENTAKYVNSPETDLYNKSNILYGFDKAKLAIRKKGFCILVEGQMDLLMSHQAGFVNTVAVSGTALTEEHLKLIKRLTGNLVFAFDPDDAGVSASKRGVDSALSLGLDVKIALLPEGLDPADLILKDKQKWLEQVEGAQHIIDFYINLLAGKDLEQRDFRVKVAESVLPYVAKLKNKINQAHFVSEIARKLEIPEDPIWEELRAVSTIQKEKKSTSPPTSVGSTASVVNSKKEMLERKILGILLWQEEMKDGILNINELEKEYRDVFNNIKERHKLNDDEKKEYIFEAEVYYSDTGGLAGEIKELIRYLRGETLKEEFEQAMGALRISENKGDVQAAAKSLKQCQKISDEINNLS